MKLLWTFITCLIFLTCFPSQTKAAQDNFVTPIFPIRSREYWRQGPDLKYFTDLKKIVSESSIPATWLIHYDILFDKEIIDSLKLTSSSSNEVGLFLEVTRKLADDSYVLYDWENHTWSAAYKIFLSSYTREQRQRMIDKAFNTFKSKFGFFPKSYGAWYFDVWSMEYIRDKYGSNIVLGLADQYSTDGYQTWGQYFDLPYYVSKTSAIEPALNTLDSTGILKLQWAPREPTLSYGNNVDFSNYSVQVNDYHRGKNLGQEYFRKLLANITVNTPGLISQAVIGIEVGEIETNFYPELINQLQTLANWQKIDKIKLSTMSGFEEAYRKNFQFVSPPGILGSEQPNKSLWWYMTPRYRIGIGIENNKLLIKDLHFYHQSSYRDNDQIISDPHENLVRVVPAAIDQVTLSNELNLGNSKDFKITKTDKSLSIKWLDQELIASQSGITFPVTIKKELDNRNIIYTDTGPRLIVIPPDSEIISKQSCNSNYGSFSGQFICLKIALVKLTKLLPDLVYSQINNQWYFGLRTDYETFLGLRIPQFKLGFITFKYPTLDLFISLKTKLTPNFTWQGRQEIDLEKYKKVGIVKEKGGDYGQNELIKRTLGKILFENSYYFVLAKE